MQTPIDVSYLADNILVLGYFEARGEVRQAISMMKKRSGGHERSIRELRLGLTPYEWELRCRISREFCLAVQRRWSRY